MKSGISVLPAIYPDRRATQPIYSQFPRHGAVSSRRSRFVDKEERESGRKSVKLTKIFVIPEPSLLLPLNRDVLFIDESFASWNSNLFDEVRRDASWGI